ncbi:MAG: restriction endonuclease subunit S [Thermoplasmata archaeon]|nr:restriction endonuclease subunit S [Thermoplasmata archaeon]
MERTRQITFDEFESEQLLQEIKGPYALPEGWKWIRLRDIVTEDRQQINPQDFPEQEFWLVTMDCVEAGTGKLLQRVIVRGKDIKSVKFRFNSRHVLYGKLRPYLNKVYVPDGEGICSTEFIPLLPKREIYRDFLAIYLRTRYVANYAMKNLTGARQPRVDLSAFFRLPVPIPFKNNNKPDLEEQKRIVAKIEDLFSKIDRIRELRRQAKEEAENLLKVALHHVFSRADEEGWKWVRLGEIAEIIMGQSPPSETYNTEGKGLPFYQGKIDFGEKYPTPRVYCITPSKIAETNDILISVRAPVGPVNIANNKCGIGRGLAAIRVKKSFNLYVFYWLKYFEDKWVRGGTTFEAITKNNLFRHKLLIPFKNGKPDLEEQKRIAAYLDKIAERQRKLLELYEQTERELEIMKQSILSKAFRGKL